MPRPKQSQALNRRNAQARRALRWRAAGTEAGVDGRRSVFGNPFELQSDVVRGLKTLVRILLQAGVHHVLEGRRSHGFAALIGSGSFSKIDDATEIWLLPSNARLPVVISYSTAPSAKMSRACVRFLSLDLFRRHVLDRPDDAARSGQRAGGTQSSHRRHGGERWSCARC